MVKAWQAGPGRTNRGALFSYGPLPVPTVGISHPGLGPLIPAGASFKKPDSPDLRAGSEKLVRRLVFRIKAA